MVRGDANVCSYVWSAVAYGAPCHRASSFPEDDLAIVCLVYKTLVLVHARP